MACLVGIKAAMASDQDSVMAEAVVAALAMEAWEEAAASAAVAADTEAVTVITISVHLNLLFIPPLSLITISTRIPLDISTAQFEF